MTFHAKQKKTWLTVLATIFCFTAFFAFSLSCASAPRQKTVRIADIKEWTGSTSVSVPCTPELSVIQWKYLVTELNKINGLNNIKLSASNSLTAMNLESTITISNSVLKYIYSLESAAGQITLTISSVEEQDPKTGSFSVTMSINEISDYKANVIRKFTNELTAHANELVAKKTALEY
ncbi:MAG: hypothetical protein ILP18_04460 [Treponema sp.]|nr:hypothetical protein [Treponema sp.]